jgi:hypothetical protein
MVYVTLWWLFSNLLDASHSHIQNYNFRPKKQRIRIKSEEKKRFREKREENLIRRIREKSEEENEKSAGGYSIFLTGFFHKSLSFFHCLFV